MNTDENGFVSNTHLDHAGWRRFMAHHLADNMDMFLMEVKAIYLFGSTQSGNAGPGSDIDLIFHMDDMQKINQLLVYWIKGWDEALCNMNFLLTGMQNPYLLDVKFIDDIDLENNKCFAAMIHSKTDPAELLRLRVAQHK